MKNKKRIFNTLSLIIMALVTLILSNHNAQAASKSIIASQVISYLNEQVGKSYPKGYCLKYVADSWVNMTGATRSSACCAYTYGSSHITSTNMSSIPIGADVFFKDCGGTCSRCHNSCGHIGIYVGNGYFVHATGGKVQKSTVSSWQSKWRGWGYHSYITINSTVVPSSTSSPDEQKAVISNVEINSISPSSVTLSWSTTGKRSKVQVISGSQSWESGWYTTSSATCTFNRNYISNCNNRVVMRIYSYSNDSGAGIGEDMHQLTYGSVGYVDFPQSVIYHTENVPSGTTISEGKFRGWIAGTSNINSVKIVINSKIYFATLSDRQDVNAAYPDYNSNYIKGWSFTVTPYEFDDGNNSYKITATLSDGSSYTINSGTFKAEKINCLFDAEYFKARYYRDANVAKLTTAAQLEEYYYHHLSYSYAPSMLFDPNYYTSSANPDIAKAIYGGQKAYEHFVHYGIKAGNEYRSLSEFVSLSYLHKYSDLKSMTPQALLEWTATWGLKLDERALADTAAARAFRKMYQCREYAALNKDLVEAYSTPTMKSDFNATCAQKYWEHLWRYGLTEGRNTSNLFCSKTYCLNAKLGNQACTYQIFDSFIHIGYSQNIKCK